MKGRQIMEYKTGIIGRLFMAIIIGVAIGAPMRVGAQTGAAPGAGGCATGARPMLVIEDRTNVAAQVMELARRAQLVPVAPLLHAALMPNPCIDLLDNDPLFWSLPGAVQPEIILRVRLGELALAELSLGDKAGSAVGRYIGSYLGNHAESVPLLKQVAVEVDVICPRTRRKAVTLAVQSNETQVPSPEQNLARLQAATQMAANEITAFLAANWQICPVAGKEKVSVAVTELKKPIDAMADR